MQTTYGRGGRDVGRKRRKNKNSGGGRSLAQLMVCLVLFLAVFIGKGVWPEQVAQTGQQLLAVIRANTNFRAAFATLGQALSEQEDLLGELGEFCVAVFAPEENQEKSYPPAVPASAFRREKLPPTDDQNQLTARYLNMDELPEDWKIPEGTVEQAIEPEPALCVGDVVQAVSEQGEDLPEGYSMQWLYLGDMETATPVRGTVTSPFGYRDHPTIKRYAAHGGVDIAAGAGTAVSAFAPGTVESVGESEDFGLYVQLDHGNGVKTFYSHCKSLSVQTGQTVQVGEKVAEVGSTGKSTGPHLHFEVKLDELRLNPLYYIQPEG